MKKKVIGIVAAIVVVLGLSLVVYNQIIPNEYVPADDEIALHLQFDTEEDIGLLLGDSEALPFPDNAFDVVYCNDSFHHYPAPQNVLREVNRVLKPGGTFLMGDCWQPFVGRVIMNFYMRHSKEGDVKIYSEAELVSMLSAYFHNVSWEQVGNTACIAMGEK